MNAKKKNKKANKPPNPNPPQNIVSDVKKEEKVEQIELKCEVKEDILPVEISSKNMTPPVSEIKEEECETPKKPKRNKSKNKKNNQEEEKSEVQEKSAKSVVEVDPKIEVIQNKSEELLDIKEDPLGDASAVPSSRKKKSKKKTQDKMSEDIKPCTDNPVLLNVEPTETFEKVEPDVQELFSAKPDTPKEGKKKKNKKKNRTDSEKSDKADVLSCTSAFDKICAVDASKQEDLSVMPEIKQQTFDVNITSNPDLEKEVIDIETSLLAEVKESKAEPETEPKSKKKNKKDKKHKEIEPAKQDTPEKSSVSIDVLTEIILEKPKLEEKECKEVNLDSQKDNEMSPKAKAKIAKPVEKKRKGKSEAQSTENISSAECTDITKDDKLITESPIPTEKIEDIPVNITESVTDDTKHQPAPIPLQMENISVPSDQNMGKKRKKSKSPKPQKDLKDTKPSIEPKIEAEISTALHTKVDIKNESKIKTENPTGPIFALPDAQSLQALIPEKKEIVVALETVSERLPTPENKLDNEGFETKTSKKKKKVPKTPIVETPTDVKESVEMPLTEKTENKLEPMQEETLDILLEPLLPPDIDIKTIPKESEASCCDIVPDVHFNRSVSQQQLDTNNNTVIQEVTNVNERKLTDLLLMPLIQGPGETPMTTPELISSGIRMTDVETKPTIEEKTDIKSKMMEVNQDMEDLRLSIERSLAEFTALDKCEMESENKQERKEKSPNKKHTENVIKPKDNISLVTEEKIPQEAKAVVCDDPSKATEAPPVCPARKDNKGKSKSKKKGKSDSTVSASTTTAATVSSSVTTSSQPKNDAKEDKKEKSSQKREEKSESSQEKGRQQSTSATDIDQIGTTQDASSDHNPINTEVVSDAVEQTDFEPIENFEDALTSSIDDVNKTFEMIAKDADDENIEFQKKLAASKPEISITEPVEDKDKDTNRNEKVNPVSQPKNLLGHTDIPVQSNRTDYKKEKNKTPNARQAKVKIKDSSEIETKKQSKESQTDNKKTRKNSDKSVKESFSKVKNDNEEYVYKYSFRKVFLQSACHVCNKELGQVKVPCGYCNLIFYCGAKHKDDDWPQHQALCFAVSTLAHMKDQTHIYADAQNTAGQDYRLLRMQMIVSCEKVLKRRLVPWEQEIMLYPRMCAELACREWRQSKLKDCDGCGQISYCASNPEHLPKSHSRWCKSYSLYQRLVGYQQTKGRLEPRLPTRVLADDKMQNKMNEVLAVMYEEKIDMNDIQYASLTQLATAPLTTAYCLQLCRSASGITNGVHKKHLFTIHVVGAELQFEADALNKWETFFLHLRPDVEELRVVLVSPALNPGHLPLNLLGKIKLCDDCQQNKRRVVFKFEDNKNYSEYRTCEDFINPDIICAFNPSIQRSSIYNGKDPWPASINSILKLKTPFIITAYTLNELRKDIARIKQVSEIDFKFFLEPGFNSFASVRPDRNFISDDEMPLLFKNYCVAVVVGC